MQMINTASGPKSPGEALEIFKRAQLPTGSLLGIYRQLLDSGCASEASIFVEKNPAKFDAKIQRLAKEQIAGRPIGPTPVTSKQRALEIITSGGFRPTLEITFRKDCARKLRLIVTIVPRLVEFQDPNAMMFLISCVMRSGEWEHIPRTYFVTLNANQHELGIVADVFGDLVESIELTSDTIDRITAVQNAAIKDRLVGRSDLFYDESVFRVACKKLEHSSDARIWIDKISDTNASMEQIIQAVPVMIRIKFLEAIRPGLNQLSECRQAMNRAEQNAG